MHGWSGIEGQEQAVALLRRAAAGRAVHAYLFAGPAGVGKRMAARTFAAALNCTGPEDAKPCGTCQPCQQMQAGNYAGYREITPVKGSLRLQQIKEVQDMLALASETGRYRVVVIEEAEKLTAEAANALLKILEEPPENTVFILITTQQAGVLPTVASRCGLVYFRPLPAGILTQLLAGGVDRPELVAALAQGSMEQATALAGDQEKILAARSEALQLWQRAVSGEYLPEVKGEKAGVDQLLQLLGWLVRDQLVQLWPEGEEYVINRDLPGRTGMPPARLVEALEYIVRAGLLLEQNVNPQLVLEATLIRLSHIAKGGK